MRRKLAPVDSPIDRALIDAEKLRELPNVEQLGERIGWVDIVAVIHDGDLARGFPAVLRLARLELVFKPIAALPPRISPLGLVPV